MQTYMKTTQMGEEIKFADDVDIAVWERIERYLVAGSDVVSQFECKEECADFAQSSDSI